MKRQVSVCLTVIFLAVLFSGCGQNVDEISTTGVLPDTTPPVVLFTLPTGTNVPINSSISVIFSEPVTNVDPFSFTVVGTGSPIAGTFTSSGSTVTFKPAAPLAFNTTYTITITTAVTDFSGNPLASGASSSFTTGAAVDTTPPTVLTTAPAGTNVPANTLITATFSEQINCLTITAASFNVMNGGLFVSGTTSCTGTAVTFTPSPALANSTLYTATLSVAVTDLAGNHLGALKQWSFTTVPADAITTSTLPPATEGGAYSQALSASGGTLPLSWSATDLLPLGLSINASTGVISGTLATGTGTGSPTYSITVTATDAVGVIATKTLSLTVNPPPSITSPSAGPVAAATQIGAYTLSLTAAGGTGTLTWNATGLPTGLSISPSTGLASSITGTVTDAPGTYDIGLTVTDTNLVTSPTVTLSLTVNAAPTITTVQADLDAAPATAGSPYAGFTPTFTGGTGTMIWNVTGLPASMTFDPATGAITGTPDIGTSGPHSITFTVTDSNGAQGSKTLTLTVI